MVEVCVVPKAVDHVEDCLIKMFCHWIPGQTCLGHVGNHWFNILAALIGDELLDGCAGWG